LEANYQWVVSWSACGAWGLGKYEAVFRENEIDETVLPSLTEEHLKQLGALPRAPWLKVTLGGSQCSFSLTLLSNRRLWIVAQGRPAGVMPSILVA
jgi:hypothetical protein